MFLMKGEVKVQEACLSGRTSFQKEELGKGTISSPTYSLGDHVAELGV